MEPLDSVEPRLKNTVVVYDSGVDLDSVYHADVVMNEFRENVEISI